MSETEATDPKVLLGHHLKKLKLPTILAEYEKQARQCAEQGFDYPRYLLRLVELELEQFFDDVDPPEEPVRGEETQDNGQTEPPFGLVIDDECRTVCREGYKDVEIKWKQHPRKWCPAYPE